MNRSKKCGRDYYVIHLSCVCVFLNTITLNHNEIEGWILIYMPDIKIVYLNKKPVNVREKILNIKKNGAFSYTSLWPTSIRKSAVFFVCLDFFIQRYVFFNWRFMVYMTVDTDAFRVKTMVNLISVILYWQAFFFLRYMDRLPTHLKPLAMQFLATISVK